MMLSVTIATDSVMNTVSQAMHSDEESHWELVTFCVPFC